MNYSLQRIWVVGALSLSLLAAEAQQPVLYFNRLSQANGLSNNKVNCILQDKRGFTWIGTDDGLNRYDGNNFIVFKNIPGQSSSVSGNTITDLHEDKDGLLWIATTDGGITRYDYQLSPDKQFRQYKHHPGDKKSIPVNIVNALKEDNTGKLWLATSGAGVIGFDKDKENFIQLHYSGNWTINDICFDKRGLIWAGKEGGSMLKVNPATLQWELDEKYSNLYVSLPHVVVTRLFKDSKQNIWFGSWDKAVYRYNNSSNTEESFTNQKTHPFSFGMDEPLAFNEDKQGRIWIGGKYFGLYVHDPASGHFYNYRYDPSKEGALSDNKVNCIFIDPSGMVWLGTNRGISICNTARQQFVQQFLPLINSQDAKPIVIYDFLKRDDGALWIGTNKGIYIKSRQGNYLYKKVTYKGTELSVTRFYKDPDGSFYVGTDYTLFRYDEKTGAVSPLPNTDKDQVMAKLIESRIVSITKDTLDGHPVLWTAPYGHFFTYYDLTEQRWVSRRDSVKKILNRYNVTDNLIRKIIKCGDGRIWFANAKTGLVRLNKHTRGNTMFINNPVQKNSISNNNVYDIIEDNKGNLWVSTYGGGLNYLDTKTHQFEHFSSINNLLEGLATDKNGNVWCISNGGLQKFDPRTKTFSYFDLPDVDKSGGVRGYPYKDTDGTMYVAGPGYYFAFDPEEIIEDIKQPEVFFTDFSIFNKSFAQLLSGHQIALKYNQNFFTFHFAAPFYTASAPVQYSYMLEGVDKDWINAGTSLPQAHYTNLGSGEYTFKVRATTTPGTWSEKITSIGIRIIPPFWTRGWFFTLLALLITAIIYFIYRYRINELLKRQAIRNKIAQDLHDNVGSTLSSISIYSQVAKIYKAKDRQEDLQNTLEKISSTSGEMISEMNDIVWAINPRNDNMDTILQRMESFAKPLLASKEIQFHLAYPDSLKTINLGMTKRKNFYLIFKEAINNTIKYSEARNLWVKIDQRHQLLLVSIKDDGKGFDSSKVKVDSISSMAGNGLHNMKRRAEEMNGEYSIESNPGQGTLITLHFSIP
ncbi:MAG TPA: two-component regulator propeller domain-containing protein [Chitinophagaceae bacterium]